MHTARWTAATDGTDGTARTGRTARTARTDARRAIVRNMKQNICYWFGQLLQHQAIYLPVCMCVYGVCVCVRAIDVQLPELPGCPGYSGAGPSLLSTMSYFIWAPRLNTLNVPHTHKTLTHTPYTHTHVVRPNASVARTWELEHACKFHNVFMPGHTCRPAQLKRLDSMSKRNLFRYENPVTPTPTACKHPVQHPVEHPEPPSTVPGAGQTFVLAESRKKIFILKYAF